MLKKLGSLILLLFLASPISPVFSAGEAPVISGLKVLPASGPAGTGYKLSLHIDDPQGIDDVSKILYQIREGIEPIELILSDKGNPELEAGDGHFSAQTFVPQTASRQRHRFEFFVRDNSGHKSNILVYHFTVLEGIQIKKAF